VTRTVLAAFFLGGVAALMHEVVWAKLLVRLIGATAYAQVAVLAVFMGGLALGSVLFGRRVDRAGRPLSMYALLELSVGAYCLLLPLLLHLAGLGYTSLATHFFESTGITRLIRFGLVITLVLFPAVLMGGTLPILARHLVDKVKDTRRQVARLYAINSLGAVVGAGIAGFVTLPRYGIYPSLVAASFLNFAAAALVFDCARRAASKELDNRRKSRKNDEHVLPTYATPQYVAAIVALALSGFAAMGYEVLVTRLIALSFGSSTYSFTVMLMCFVTGISLGSAIVSRLNVTRPLWLLCGSQFAVVAGFMLATPLMSRLPYLIGLLRIQLSGVEHGFELYLFGKALLCLAVLLIPTTCLGFSFPLVAQIRVRDESQLGACVGSTYAWNAIGNVLGVLVTGLLLLPSLGLLGGFHVNLGFNFAAGCVLLLVASEARLELRGAAGVAASLAVAVYASFGTGWTDPVNFARNHLRMRSGPAAALDPEAHARHPSSSFEAWKQTYVGPRAGKRLFLEEDAHNTVVVSGERNIQLFVNSKPDASTVSDLETQLLVGHLPLFLSLEARTLLVIGHGSGITAGAALRHPIESADIVEISPAVLRADRFFADHNHHVLDDPRVRVYTDDAQSFLRAVPRSYDLIISEPSNPWVAGIGALFTLEFFENARRQLNTGGRFALWFQTYELTDEAVQLVIRTIGSVFPHIMLFGDDDLSNIIALCSMELIEPDFSGMESRFRRLEVRDDLARMRLPNLSALLSHHRVSQKRFSSLTGPGPLNTIGHERLEYMGPRSFFARESSFFIERFDPVIRGVEEETDVLLDRYIAYRAASGSPMSRRELTEARRYAESLDGYGTEIARWIEMRAERALSE